MFGNSAKPPHLAMRSRAPQARGPDAGSRVSCNRV